eukprot:gene7324-biopygen12040
MVVTTGHTHAAPQLTQHTAVTTNNTLAKGMVVNPRYARVAQQLTRQQHAGKRHGREPWSILRTSQVMPSQGGDQHSTHTDRAV